MPLTDPIADLLTRMRNGQRARHTEVRAPWSKIKQSMCEVLKANGYLSEVAVEGEASKRELVVTFAENKPPLLLKRVSTPGGRRYVGAGEARPFLHGATIAVISTSEGLMTHKDAKKKNIGGEILCTVA